MQKGWRIAMALALVGALLALASAYLHYERTRGIAYGKIALAIGVPALFYAIARASRNAR